MLIVMIEVTGEVIKLRLPCVTAAKKAALIKASGVLQPNLLNKPTADHTGVDATDFLASHSRSGNQLQCLELDLVMAPTVDQKIPGMTR
jgi:hypothetical protein